MKLCLCIQHSAMLEGGRSCGAMSEMAGAVASPRLPGRCWVRGTGTRQSTHAPKLRLQVDQHSNTPGRRTCWRDPASSSSSGDPHTTNPYHHHESDISFILNTLVSLQISHTIEQTIGSTGIGRLNTTICIFAIIVALKFSRQGANSKWEARPSL